MIVGSAHSPSIPENQPAPSCPRWPFRDSLGNTPGACSSLSVLPLPETPWKARSLPTQAPSSRKTIGLEKCWCLRCVSSAMRHAVILMHAGMRVGSHSVLSDYLKHKRHPDSEMSRCKLIWLLYPKKYGRRVGV